MTQPSLFGQLDKPACVVLFSGGGGACEGIRRAVGAPVLMAVNHDPASIRMHAANHPETLHIQEDVWAVVPRQASRGRKPWLLWMSPACTHFSRAKGSSPLSEQSRSLADVVFPWIESARPAVIVLENVLEFQDWGPLDEKGRPVRDLQGAYFRAWVDRVRSHGYTVDWRGLAACDYGAPTVRKRLYLVARCDGKPIRWPVPSHGPGALPYRTAAECIDWSLPGAPIDGRSVPLCARTRARIEAARHRYGERCIVAYYGSERDGQGIDEPLRTVTTKDRFGVVIGDTFRMLSPRECARAMGFSEDYRLEGTRAEQIARIGNAVCPPVAEAIVKALAERIWP